KRLADAQRDGDRIYAVIDAVGGGSDGKSLGLTAPRAQGQARTLARAYERAGVSPGEVGLVEAHGTGTVVGDRTELEVLNQFFGNAGAPTASIALGSIKSQIGHTKCAAGLAGLVKVALSLHHRVLPPTLNITSPNPGWTPGSPFTLSSAARPWPVRRRIAGVSAFGFGGTNFHVVLESYEGEDATTGLPRWPAELFLFRGADRAAALARIDKLVRTMALGERPLAELARAAGEGPAAVQIAIVAHDAADLARKIALAREGNAHASGVFIAPGEAQGEAKLAFLFPGQGSQRVGMLADLFIAFPQLQQLLEQGERWRGTIFPPSAWQAEDEHAQQAALTDTRVAQPALGISGLAMAQILDRFGVRPDMLAGHSYGELVALCVAGALPEAALLELSALRGRRILEACADATDAGTMAAVAADAATTAAHLAGIAGVVIANENSPVQSVISGPRRAVELAVERLLEAGVAAKTIPVACAFHSPLVQGACAVFAADLATIAIDIAAPSLPVYSNTTTALYPHDPAAVRALLAEHIGQPVRFAAEIEAMYAAGARIFVEAGPGRVLTGLVGRILGKRPHVATACDRPGENGIAALMLALGQLAVQGVPVDADAWFADRDIPRISLDTPPPPLHSASAWWVNGQRAWPMHGDSPANAMRPVTTPVLLAKAEHVASAPDAPREAVMLEYLRGMREMADTQRRVMLDYLGSGDLAPRLPIDVVANARDASLPRVSDEPAVVAAQVPAGESAIVSAQDVETMLLDVVAQRTGYPIEMLGLDLDLEADLSIDSIKRVEILGKMAGRLRIGTSAGAEYGDLPDELVAAKTLRDIVVGLTAFKASAVPESPVRPDDATAPQPSASRPDAISRYVLQAAHSGRGDAPWRFAGRDIGIVGAPGRLDDALIARLAASDSKGLTMLDGDGTKEAPSVLIDLTPLRPGWKSTDVPALFARVRDALMKGATHVLVAGAIEGDRQGERGRRINGHCVPSAAGVGGMIRSLRKEWLDRQIRVARFVPELDPAMLAAQILDELNAVAEEEIAYSRDGVRLATRVVACDRPAGTGAGLATAPPAIALDAESVVLLTGGARGITSTIARELAARYRCRLELAGRTPLPTAPEAADLAAAGDDSAVRRALIARGDGARPAAIEAACARILAEREIRSTLAAIAQAGSPCRYHAIDVRNSAAMHDLVGDIYARHGRLDGVIHGAGVIEDKLAREKTPDSFARVFETKVNGAMAIAESVRHDIGFLVFFSSIASTHGSRGQSDYAAANDFLDGLAGSLNATLPGRVLSINWGPWAAPGMVSPSLVEEYARRGIGLIAPEAGVASFFDELLYGAAGDAQVILMQGSADAIA
ncbi:MAG: SDR family NAD(P)-dependent oxidoreductase, partial [Casimicrobiaceae bacterium]